MGAAKLQAGNVEEEELRLPTLEFDHKPASQGLGFLANWEGWWETSIERAHEANEGILYHATEFDKVAPAVWSGIVADGLPQDVILILDDREIQRESEAMRVLAGLYAEDAALLALKSSRLNVLQDSVLESIPKGQVTVLRKYKHLPFVFLRVNDLDALTLLVARPELLRVQENARIPLALAQSLPLVQQPAAAAAGYRGAGSTIAVIDSGVDFGHFECTAPGVPADTCQIAAAVELAGRCSGSATDCVASADCPVGQSCVYDGTHDDLGHGTLVAGVALAVAPAARVIDLDANIPGTGFVLSAAAAAAADWAIAQRDEFGIVAVNASFGAGTFTAPCGPGDFYYVISTNLKSRGMQWVPASGNGGSSNGLNETSCPPTALSVGAVYDSAQGSVSFTNCTDSSTFADKVTCYSQSAPFLKMLAPGSRICAVGQCAHGTSFAAPFVSGAVAVLQSQFSREMLDRTVARLTQTGSMVTDSRNGIMTPRLNLAAAVSTSETCDGDCDENGSVSVNEIILGVNIANEDASIFLCRAMDANNDNDVTIDELIIAVDRSLRGCFTP